MADAKRCDICETYYMPYEGKKKLNNFYFSTTSLNGVKRDNCKVIDLCPDCFLEISECIKKSSRRSIKK